jgi:hypothetical protein
LAETLLLSALHRASGGGDGSFIVMAKESTLMQIAGTTKQ